jgi:hypothetical protein
MKHSGNNDLPAIDKIDDAVWESGWEKLTVLLVVYLANMRILLKHGESIIHRGRKLLTKAFLLAVVPVLCILQIRVCPDPNDELPPHL